MTVQHELDETQMWRMSQEEFLNNLNQICAQNKMILYIPKTEWTFGPDNIQHLKQAMDQLEKYGTVQMVLHTANFTEDNHHRQKICSFVARYEHVIELAPKLTRLAFSKDKNGNAITPPDHFDFVWSFSLLDCH